MKNIKRLIFSTCILLSVNSAFARDTTVRGYVRQDGTVVQSYHRTSPDSTVNNNYGTQGNQNPYTGQDGTRPRNDSQGLGTYNPGNGMGMIHSADDANQNNN